MKTIKIRDLRGSTLEELAAQGQMVGISRDRALIAVVVPMVQAWVEHMIDQNWSQILQSATRTELNPNAAADTLEAVLSGAGVNPASGASGIPPQAVGVGSSTPTRTVLAGPARMSRELTAPALEMLRRLAAALGHSDPSGESNIRTSTSLRIGELSAKRIEQAESEGELLILTNDRALIGIVVPVSQRLVEFLVSQNLSRVLRNAQRAEAEADGAAPLTTLETVAKDATFDSYTSDEEYKML